MNIDFFDSIGQKLNLGDLLKVQTKMNLGLTFYVKLQFSNGNLVPLSKFAFDRIIKIDKLPEDAIECSTKDFIYWMHPKTEIYLIDHNILEKWKMDTLYFEHNSFYKISE